MTTLAVDLCMTTHQRETRLEVDVLDAKNRPALRCVAALAVWAELGVVHVPMTVETITADSGEVLQTVARGALQGPMLPDQCKSGRGMLKTYLLERFKFVTGLAIPSQFLVRHVLGRHQTAKNNECQQADKISS